MEILSANISDAAVRKLFSEHDDFMQDFLGEDRDCYTRYSPAENIEMVWVAYEGNVPTGCAAYRTRSDGVGEVKRLFVKKGYRGRGISKAMLSEVKSHAKAEGCKKLFLDTRITLEPAVTLYRSFGFEITFQQGLYISNGNRDLIHFERKIIMFCGNCGKEIVNTRFCQYCGAEQNAVVIPGAGIPVSAPINEAADTVNAPEAASVPITSTPAADAQSALTEPSATSLGAPANESAPIAGAAAPEQYETSVSAGLPTPNTIPAGNIGMSETAVYSAPFQTSVPAETALSNEPENAPPQTEITIKDEEKRTPERKYSLKHIVMCLAAAAVMAVAAGVFAGLYFSVILA